MNKDQMAHEYVLEMLKTTHANHGFLNSDEIGNLTETAWSIADAMQAEADKRQGGVPEAVLKASNSRELDIQGVLHDIDDYFDQAECTKTPRMANNLLAQIYEQLSGEIKTSEMEAERHG